MYWSRWVASNIWCYGQNRWQPEAASFTPPIPMLKFVSYLLPNIEDFHGVVTTDGTCINVNWKGWVEFPFFHTYTLLCLLAIFVTLALVYVPPRENGTCTVYLFNILACFLMFCSENSFAQHSILYYRGNWLMLDGKLIANILPGVWVEHGYIDTSGMIYVCMSSFSFLNLSSSSLPFSTLKKICLISLFSLVSYYSGQIHCPICEW